MLNTTNYFQKTSNIDWENVPEALAKGHRLVEGASQENWSPYRTNENIKRVVDAYFKKLDEYMAQNPVKPSGDKKAPVKTATSKPVKKVSTPVKKAAPVITYKTDNVEHLDTDVCSAYCRREG